MMMYDWIDDPGYCEYTTDDRADLNQEMENVSRGLCVLNRHWWKIISSKELVGGMGEG